MGVVCNGLIISLGMAFPRAPPPITFWKRYICTVHDKDLPRLGPISGVRAAGGHGCQGLAHDSEHLLWQVWGPRSMGPMCLL